MENSPQKRRARSEAMKAETWEKKVAAIGERINSIRDGKSNGQH